MKKFYHTLAIAAVAAVSLFSAQSAKAQLLREAPKATVMLGIMDEDEPELKSDDPIVDYFKGIYDRALDVAKKQVEKGRKFTKEEIKTFVDGGKLYGYTEEYIRAYIGQPAD